ncbi:10683_t:CDS:2 [Funneliformis caledonium]|uniref:10683_t:CDS:1 n=1 Tax=Funneliformis caledonium TaxID=1117310 RepID=A0A9N9GW33_9GLOM|nr:10683_t:CDS:2 [Funneliformis caledonium]
MESASLTSGFTIKCELKEEATKILRKEGEFPSSYSTIEDERMAKKIRDPEAYYQKWNKVSQAQLESQLDKNKRKKVY